MKFDTQHKVLMDSISEDEAKMYICFLSDERARHEDEIEECNRVIHGLGYWRPSYWSASVEFWQSAVQRHEEDIMDIDELIECFEEQTRGGDNFPEGKFLEVWEKRQKTHKQNLHRGLELLEKYYYDLWD